MSEYPVRCRIIDVTGREVLPGVEGKTPDESRPHIGKEGLAEEIEEAGEIVRITLDNGTVLWGSECWWTPIVAKKTPSPTLETSHMKTRRKFRQITVDSVTYLYSVSLRTHKIIVYQGDQRFEWQLPNSDKMSTSWRGKHQDGAFGKREVAEIIQDKT